MMTEWFECKVRYDKTLESGLIKKTTDPYLVDALSFTEAEKRFLEEITPFMTGDFMVTDIKRAKLTEVFESEDLTDDRWYKARVAFITIDEKNGVEKRSVQTMLVQAKDFGTAYNHLEARMKGTLGDYVIISIAETQIVDIYRYVPTEESK